MMDTNKELIRAIKELTKAVRENTEALLETGEPVIEYQLKVNTKRSEYITNEKGS